MRHRSTGRECCKRRTAGIGKQIQYADRTVCAVNQAGKPVPVDGLFRKQSRVFEGKWLETEGQPSRIRIQIRELIGNLPLLRQIMEFPAAAASAAAVIMSVMFPLAGRLLRRVPDYLRIRPHESVRTPLFELFPGRCVQYFIIVPSVSNPHRLPVTLLFAYVIPF